MCQLGVNSARIAALIWSTAPSLRVLMLRALVSALSYFPNSLFPQISQDTITRFSPATPDESATVFGGQSVLLKHGVQFGE